MISVLSPIIHNDGEKRGFSSHNRSPTQPHRQSSSKPQSRIHEAVCILDEVARDRERYRDFGYTLQHAPHACADHDEAQYQRPWTAAEQVRAGGNEEACTDLSAQGEDVDLARRERAAEFSMIRHVLDGGVSWVIDRQRGCIQLGSFLRRLHLCRSGEVD